jgi:hypothetical protein
MITIKKTSKTIITMTADQNKTHNVFTFSRNNTPYFIVKYKIKKIDFQSQPNFNDCKLDFPNGSMQLNERNILISYGKNQQVMHSIDANTDYRADMFQLIMPMFDRDIMVEQKKYGGNPLLGGSDYVNAAANGINAGANCINAITNAVSTLSLNKDSGKKTTVVRKKKSKKPKLDVKISASKNVLQFKKVSNN